VVALISPSPTVVWPPPLAWDQPGPDVTGAIVHFAPEPPKASPALPPSRPRPRNRLERRAAAAKARRRA
jgi:hypothetical protein